LKLEDFAGLTISEAAELIRHEPAEQAVIYGSSGTALFFRRSLPGHPLKVVIPFGKGGLLRGNVLLHNHPGNQSFSIEDIWILLRHGAREVQAYGPDRAFRMVATDSTRRFGYREEAGGMAELKAAYGRNVAATNARFSRFAAARLFTSEQAWAAQTHSVVRRIAIQFRFAYQEIRP
jgi:hypothetical protein